MVLQTVPLCNRETIQWSIRCAELSHNWPEYAPGSFYASLWPKTIGGALGDLWPRDQWSGPHKGPCVGRGQYRVLLYDQCHCSFKSSPIKCLLPFVAIPHIARWPQTQMKCEIYPDPWLMPAILFDCRVPINSMILLDISLHNITSVLQFSSQLCCWIWVDVGSPTCNMLSFMGSVIVWCNSI